MYGGHEVWPSGQLQVIAFLSTIARDSNFKVKLGTCTGTLVSPSWILTAAHCFPAKTKRILLKYGGRDPKGRWKCVERAKQVVFHSERIYGGDFRLTDVVLVEVGRCHHHLQPMELRRKGQMEDKLNCTIAGFGYNSKTDEKSGTWKPGSLRQLQVSASDVSLVVPQRILLWVGASGHGPCMGDSGGPLICNGMLYGVLSRIVHRQRVVDHLCGWPNGTAVYEDVADYADWIEHVIRTRTTSGGIKLGSCAFLLRIMVFYYILEIYYLF